MGLIDRHDRRDLHELVQSKRCDDHTFVATSSTAYMEPQVKSQDPTSYVELCAVKKILLSVLTFSQIGSLKDSCFYEREKNVSVATLSKP